MFSSDGQYRDANHNTRAVAHPFPVVGHLSCETHAVGASHHQNQEQSMLNNDFSSGGIESVKNQLSHSPAHPFTVDGQRISEILSANAGDHPYDDDCHCALVNHCPVAEVVTLRHRDQDLIDVVRRLYKQRNDIIRAHGNLTRQVISICRHAAGFNTFLPEKERNAAQKAGDKLLDALKEGREEAIDVFDNAGFLLDVIKHAGFSAQKSLIEKKMALSAKMLGMSEFVKQTSGFSSTQLASIIGEAGDLASYATVSRLWKRMGMAVINGERQSKQSDKGKAMDHGYNPSRRSAMWNIGETVLKAQIRSVKDESGRKTGESIAIGPLGHVYLERKKDYAARNPEKSKKHIHNDAKRYMEKRLLKLLWLSWNK